jgi:glutathione S-transferase
MVRHGVPAMAVRRRRNVPLGRGEPPVRAALALFDAELRQRPFLAGEAFSVADITALVAVDFMRAGRMTRPEELTGLNQWHERVSSRPSAKA